MLIDVPIQVFHINFFRVISTSVEKALYGSTCGIRYKNSRAERAVDEINRQENRSIIQ